MPTAVKSFEAIQAGIESTAGSAVAATRVLVGNGILREVIDRYYSEHPRGVLATVGGDGVDVMKGCEFEIETELNTPEAVWPFLLGVLGGISPTTGTLAETWSFSPADLTALPTLDTATIEFVESDGSSNHIQTEAQYVHCSEIEISLVAGQVGILRWRGFGRARQSATPTAALTPYTDAQREVLASSLATVYLDTSWANLGNTQLATAVREIRIQIQCFPVPGHTLDGRTDLDFTKINYRPLAATIEMTLDLDASAAARMAAWRAGTRQFVRVDVTGSNIEGALDHLFRLDGAYRITAKGDPSDGGEGVMTQSFTLQALYDGTGAEIIEATIVNTIDETEL